MLEIRTAKISFDGKTKLVTADDFNTEIAKLYRELGTNDAKLKYAIMLISKHTKRSFDDTLDLEKTAQIRNEIESLLDAAVLERPRLEYKKKTMLALFDAEHSYKKGTDLDTKDCSNTQNSLEKKIQEISAEAAANGNADAEEMLNTLDALDQLVETTEDSNSDEELTEPSFNKKAETTQTAFADTDQILTNDRKKTSKGIFRKQRILEIVTEFTERKSNNVNSNSGCQDYQVVCSDKLKKSSEYAEVQTKYKLVFEKLIKAIKNGTKEGQPETLKGKTPYGLRQYSRRISSEHRLVYAYDHKNKTIHIIECGGHYGQ
jgi:Txe/YoeB family toxin of Txe-Axe toxin-antitoxin module